MTKRKQVSFAGEEPGPNSNEKFSYPPGGTVSNSVATWDLTPHIPNEEHFADDGYLKRLLGYFSQVKEGISKTINDWNEGDVPAKRFAQSSEAIQKSDAAKDRRLRYNPTQEEHLRIKEGREYSDSIAPIHMFEDAVLTNIPLEIPPEFLKPEILRWASLGRLRYSQENPVDYEQWIRKYPFYIKSYDNKLDNYVKSLRVGRSIDKPSKFELETIFWFNYEFAKTMSAAQEAAEQEKRSGGKLRRSKRKLSKRSKKSRKNKNTK